MSTKTMRLPPRRVVTPLKKREEREAVQPPPAQASKPTTAEPTNNLLAGYLAHEFLSKGTLFGQPWDPAQVELSGRCSVAGGTKKRNRAAEEAEVEDEAAPRGAEKKKMEKEGYVAVSNLLRSDWAHFHGIVNPTQLANFFLG